MQSCKLGICYPNVDAEGSYFKEDTVKVREDVLLGVGDDGEEGVEDVEDGDGGEGHQEEEGAG